MIHTIKKKIITIAAITILSSYLTGCAESEESLNSNISELKQEIVSLKSLRDKIKQEIVDTKVENGTAQYLVTFEIKQKHYSLNYEDYIKDNMNAVSIQIPVSQEYYESIEIGDVIEDSFRTGSAVMNGSYGRWDISVENKEIQ